MNRFKTKKKAPKDDVSETRSSLESESFSLFRRGKKTQEPEIKMELDLTTALPSNDDFRTSLLMNGLSARFSMLREQDDPKSKIGKASDDSVLFPNRQSRLADFGFGTGLRDIAEVESLKAPSMVRKDSDASNDSGMMTRSRPNESNVLFGGRQKIYRVATSKNTGDGFGGRVVYHGDITSSSFQKWRVTEKEKEMSGEDHDGEKAIDDGGHEDDSFITRSESPVHGYNKKRETSSTTSSTPSGGRNSTAATSIHSQPTTTPTASKEGGQSVNSTPGVDRQVTRTRKLYEQGLTKNLQEQQNSVLTRVDTLARRPGTGCTPEMSPNTPSPTTQTFNDRWGALGSERRIISSKGSAPSLRSISPPATGSLNGKMTLDTSFGSASEVKGGLFMTPPLSPPISDFGTGEHVNLDIQAKDVGKATAMNVFQKPTSPYDDAKYAERMRQLQQGRATPTQRSRDDAKVTFPHTTAQSPSSREKESDIKTTVVSAPKKANAPAQEDCASGLTFFQDDSPTLNEYAHSPRTPELRIERPSDQDHPAFRGVTCPKPLNFPQTREPLSPDLPTPDFCAVGLRPATLADSPTLGPTTGGLSVMVRRHLRSESDVSSIYGPSPQPSPKEFDAKIAQEEHGSVESHINDVERSLPSTEPMPSLQGSSLESQRSPDDESEFADQLADARRRVREKLTSFVETDSVHNSPPMLAEPMGDLPPPPSRSNPLGILKGKSSRGSLVDRARGGKEPDDEEDAHPSLRAFRQARRELQKRKEQETGVTASPYQRSNRTSPRTDEQTHMANEGRREVSRTPSGERFPYGTSRQPRQMDSSIPEGLTLPPPRSRSRTRRERSGSDKSDGSSESRNGTPLRSMGPSHANDSQLMPSEMPNGQAPRRPIFRSPGLPGTDVRGSPIAPPVGPRNGRRSAAPASPASGFNDPANLKSLPGRAMTAPMTSAPFAGASLNGRLEQPRNMYPSNSSPGSAAASGASTPTLPPSRRPSIPSSTYANSNGSTLTDAMKRSVNKRDISEPTFVMSTSRVPTTDLPQDGRRSGSVSGSSADHDLPPPLPPVNPRRKRDNSTTRTLMNGFKGLRRNEESDAAAFSRSTPQLPLANPAVSSYGNPANQERANANANSVMNEEDPRNGRRRLRKVSSELAMGIRASSNPMRISPQQVATGSIAGRAVTPRGGPSSNMNGGMF